MNTLVDLLEPQQETMYRISTQHGGRRIHRSSTVFSAMR